MTSFLYDTAKARFLSGTFAMVTDNVCVLLTSGQYASNENTVKSTHSILSDITSQVTDPLGSYIQGGKALSNKTVTINVSSHAGVFDADDISWANSTITSASGAVIYKSGATAALSPLIAYVDFGGLKSSSNGLFQITWSSNGIFSIND